MTPIQKARFEKLCEEAKQAVPQWSYETKKLETGMQTTFWTFDKDCKLLFCCTIREIYSNDEVGWRLDKFEGELYAYQEMISGQQRDKEIATMGEEVL